MKVSKLKTIVLIVWGMIGLALAGLLGIVLVSRADLRTALKPNTGQFGAATPSLVSLPPTRPATASPGVIYLPSATARATTPEPVTPTPIPVMPLPMLQYFSTLSPDANPLTGLIPANPQILNRRPVAVKISSFPRGIVRPVQSGLTRADLVYEYFIGDDHLTRFIAVYYSQNAERAGPVRSGRYFDEHIMRMYHSALVFASADKERVLKHLLESDLLPLLFLDRDDNFPPYWNSGSGIAETRIFVNTAGVGPKLTDNSRQNLRASLFASLLYPLSLPSVNRIYTHYSKYSYNYWEYDPARQTYKRFSDAADSISLGQGEVYAAHIDNLTGEQLSADNLVVLSVPHIFHNEFDREDLVIDITLTGSGPATLFRNGRMLKATWFRDKADQPIQLKDENGFLVPMKPGVTWYQVINPESTIKESDDSMEFFFFIPLLKVTPTPTPFGWRPTATPTKKRH